MDSVGEKTWKSTALLPVGTPNMHLDICPLPDICLESNRPSTATDSFDETVMKDSVSSLMYKFTNMLFQVGLHIRAYSETIINVLPRWQPSPVFYQRAEMVMSMTPALDVLIILAFIWSRFKSKTNQTTSYESRMRMSVLDKKIRLTKGKLRRTKRMLSASHRFNRKLKACVGELERTCETTREERDSLSMTVNERKERIRSAQLEQETLRKTFRQREMALQQKLQQLDQDWRVKLAEAMKDKREYEQHMNKEIQALQHKLCKTGQLHQIQVTVLETKQEIRERAASDFLKARKQMTLSWEKYQKLEMTKTS